MQKIWDLVVNLVVAHDLVQDVQVFVKEHHFAP